MDDNKLGINLRSLLCPGISLFQGDLKNYQQRNQLIDTIEMRIQECDWLSLSDGTTFTNTFDPSKKTSKPVNTLKENNIFRRKFHAYELFGWFQHHFPKANAIEIYRGDNPYKVDWDNNVWNIRKDAYRNYHPKHRKEYTLYDEPLLCVQSSSEYSFVRFLIEDDESHLYVVSWGYKRCNVDRKNYAAMLTALLLNTCHQFEFNPPLDRNDYCTVACRDYYIKKNEEDLAGTK